MIRCSSCLIPDTRPDTAFVAGKCSACISYEARQEIDWDARKRELELILERGKNSSGFDCIVPSSGGKDSHAQVAALLELGARPLVVTASTCHLTQAGRANIDNLSRYATTIEMTPNRAVRAKLNKAGMKLVGDISWPEHAAIFSVPFRASVLFGIPLVFYGECPQHEYGAPSTDAAAARTMTRRWVHEFGGLLGLRASDLADAAGVDRQDTNDYVLPADGFMELVGTTAYFLGQFMPWNSHENASAAASMGMQQFLPCVANYWPHENLDNAQTGLHDHMMYRKYGYGRGCAQISVDIRNGLISREQAALWVEMHDGLFPSAYAGVRIESVLERIDMSFGELIDVMNQFTNWELFDNINHNRPMLKEAA